MTRIIVTVKTLKTVAGPKADEKVLVKIANGLNEFFPAYQINNQYRVASFLAQAAQETGRFQWLEEQCWDNKCKSNPVQYFNNLYGSKYGNRPGTNDGWAYRGRGLLHLTFRGNYQLIEKRIKYYKPKSNDYKPLDLGAHPYLAANPHYACIVACSYWDYKSINKLADKLTLGNVKETMKQITAEIVGGDGSKALNERIFYYNILISSLEYGATANDSPSSMDQFTSSSVTFWEKSPETTSENKDASIVNDNSNNFSEIQIENEKITEEQDTCINQGDQKCLFNLSKL